jgi:hypothetical protein
LLDLSELKLESGDESTRISQGISTLGTVSTSRTSLSVRYRDPQPIIILSKSGFISRCSHSVREAVVIASFYCPGHTIMLLLLSIDAVSGRSPGRRAWIIVRGIDKLRPSVDTASQQRSRIECYRWQERSKTLSYCAVETQKICVLVQLALTCVTSLICFRVLITSHHHPVTSTPSEGSYTYRSPTITLLPLRSKPWTQQKSLT